MNDPSVTLNALSEIVTESCEWSRSQQLGAYSAVSLMLKELETYIEQNAVRDRLTALSKLKGINTHLKAMYGLDCPGGHSVGQHAVWVLSGLSAVSWGIFGPNKPNQPTD